MSCVLCRRPDHEGLGQLVRICHESSSRHLCASGHVTSSVLSPPTIRSSLKAPTQQSMRKISGNEQSFGIPFRVIFLVLYVLHTFSIRLMVAPAVSPNLFLTKSLSVQPAMSALYMLWDHFICNCLCGADLCGNINSTDRLFGEALYKWYLFSLR